MLRREVNIPLFRYILQKIMDDHNIVDSFQTTNAVRILKSYMKSFVPLINEEADLNRQFPSGNELKQDTPFFSTHIQIKSHEIT